MEDPSQLRHFIRMSAEDFEELCSWIAPKEQLDCIIVIRNSLCTTVNCFKFLKQFTFVYYSFDLCFQTCSDQRKNCLDFCAAEIR